MIQATAPGKIILFGEHAVVYGHPAIATPLMQRYAQATVTPNATGFRCIAPDLGEDWFLASASPENPLAMIIRQTLTHLQQPSPNITLTVTGTIPLGRGLGSGAAVSTAIVRVLAKQFNQALSPAEISALVYDVEKLYHGTPSGIDNTVIAFEQPVYFIKGRPIERLRVKQPFTLIVADTGIVSPTHKVVGDLRQRWQIQPDLYGGYFDEIGAIARQARVVLEVGRVGLMALGGLMTANHELLQTIGVSSTELDRLVEAAHQAGAWGAKLSGAGWGGNMIALSAPEQAETIAARLRQAGAVETIITNVEASGL